ncbi:MAG: sugar transferase [Candidatus Melainabacteria bacterium]
MAHVLTSPSPVQVLPGVAENTDQSEESPSLQAFRADRRIKLILQFRSANWAFRLQHLAKRSLDILLTVLGLIAISPLLLTIALLIGITSPGPIIYKSKRIGKNYKPFYMYKFRTMATNADDLREQLRQQANLQGELFKIDNDPRITWIGKYLRATSLDELPQLLNVILGDMSLVGPRPLPPDESDYFMPPFTNRFNVLPGITGLWQVSGRSNLSFKQLSQLELSYVLDWSLWNDLKILLNTVPVVLLRRGAC